MAYATKYQFEFVSLNGITGKVLIQKDGYSGDPISRACGRAPVIRKEDAGNGICGTSLTLYAECQVDEEFADLYTSDARKFKVLVQRGGTTIWRGFIVPELYSDPDIAPPYDVEITATDGLGELKSYEFTDSTRRSLLDHLVNLLTYTGIAPSSSEIIIINSIIAQSPFISNLLDVYIDCSHLIGKNCYDVLASLLATFNATITQHNCAWLLVRDTDVSVSSLAVSAKNGQGSAVSLPVGDYGSMASHDWWPVDKMDRAVVPAKNKVTVDLPYQFRPSMFTNHDFAGGTIAGWTGNKVTFAPSTYGLDKPVIGSDGGYLRQSVAVSQYDGRMLLKFNVATIQANIGWLEAKTLSFDWKLTLTSGGTTYYLVVDLLTGYLIWSTQDLLSAHISLEVINGNGGRFLTENDLTEISFEIAGFPASGTLNFSLENNNTRDSVTLVVSSVNMTAVLPNGYRDIVILDNDAREEREAVTLGFGDAPSGLTIPRLTITNHLENSLGSSTIAWKSAKIPTAREFISLMALDYAMATALPRLKLKGIINVPAAQIPAFFEDTNYYYIVRTYEFDLWNDELSVEMLTLPAASISVDSETVRTLDNEEYREVQQSTGGSTAGSSAGSAGGSRGGGTNLAFEERMGMIVQGSGTNDLTVLLDPSREIPITNQLVKNDYPSAYAVKQIVAGPEYPPVEVNGTLYLLVEEVG